jgi:hypothetical protein
MVQPASSSLLSYAQSPMLGVVVYLQVRRDAAARQRLSDFTHAVVDQLISIQATYYLCYGQYFTGEQLHRMYPRFGDLVQLKKVLDPEQRFTNAWWNAVTSDSVSL